MSTPPPAQGHPTGPYHQGQQGYPQPTEYQGQTPPGYAHPDRPYPGQPGQSGQVYPGQAYPGQPYQGQPYPGGQAQPYGSWQASGQPGGQMGYPPGPYPQAGPGAPGNYPPAAESLPLPAGPAGVHWPGMGTVAIPSMGVRLLARLIDFCVVVFGVAVLGALVGVLVGALEQTSASSSAVTGVGVVLVILVALLGPALYEIGLIATKGATLGKRAMGVRVVRAEDARLLGWGRATGRYLIPLAGVLLPFIGTLFAMLCFLSPFFDSSGRRQGWHDRVARSVAIAPR